MLQLKFGEIMDENIITSEVQGLSEETKLEKIYK